MHILLLIIGALSLVYFSTGWSEKNISDKQLTKDIKSLFTSGPANGNGYQFLSHKNIEWMPAKYANIRVANCHFKFVGLSDYRTAPITEINNSGMYMDVDLSKVRGIALEIYQVESENKQLASDVAVLRLGGYFIDPGLNGAMYVGAVADPKYIGRDFAEKSIKKVEASEGWKALKYIVKKCGGSETFPQHIMELEPKSIYE